MQSCVARVGRRSIQHLPTLWKKASCPASLALTCQRLRVGAWIASEQGANDSLDKLSSSCGQFLCANGLPFAIAIREDVREQSLVFAAVSRFDYGAIHDPCVTINSYIEIFEALVRVLLGPGMLA